MERDRIVQSIGLGAAAGLIGTAAIAAARHKASSEPSGVDRIPNPSVIDASKQVGDKIRNTAATLRSIGSGSTVVGLYSALHEEPRVLRNGLLLGLGIWGTGKLGWLPAWHSHSHFEKKRGRTFREIAQFALFGVAIAGAYRTLRRNAEEKEA